MSRPPIRKQIAAPDGGTLQIWLDPAAGETMPQLFWNAVRRRGDRVALRERRADGWRALTWAELGRQVRHIGLGLKSIGFGRHDAAAILAGNSVAWLASDMAIQGVAGVAVGLDAQMKGAALREALTAQGCKVVFVDDAARLAAVQAVRAACPGLQQIIMYDGADDAAIGLDELQARGAQYDADHLGQWEQLIDLARVHERAIVVYDGARPLAFSHRSLVLGCVNGSRALGLEPGDERLAALPLSDVRERIAGAYYAIYAGAVSGFGGPFPAAVGEARRTVLAAPPALLEPALAAGLDHCRLMVAQDAPAPAALREACAARGIGLREAWCPAEAGGLAAIAAAGEALQPVPYGEMRAAGGQVRLRGGHLCMDGLDEDGWLVARRGLP